MNRCFECLKEFTDDLKMCPYCGCVHSKEPRQPIDLMPGTILENRFYLGRSTSSGGFGIVYRAYDIRLETIVAVKEFYPGNLITRAEGTADIIVSQKVYTEYKYRKGRFLAEARNLAKFGSNNNIPNVFEFFEANNTAYIAMEFLEGESLSNYLEREKKCSRDFTLKVVNDVCNALISMHNEGIIHKDVAPDNIFVCTNGNIMLLDLGAAKLKDYKEEVVDIILKPGFSPPEQYDKSNVNIGWNSDIYALGATMYFMLTGCKPDESTNRKINDELTYPHILDPMIPESLSNTIMKAMAVDPHMRFKTVPEFLKAVNGEIKVISVEAEKKKKRFRRFTGIAATLVVLLGVSVFFGFEYSQKRKEEILKPVTIEVWASVNENSSEGSALESIVAQFHDSFPDVTVNIRTIPANQYQAELAEAASSGKLPDLFESTGLSDDILSNAKSVEKVLRSEEAKECLFLDQYQEYYDDSKKIPLGFEVPIAFVITSGPVQVDYDEQYFTSLDDFRINSISVSDEFKETIDKTFDLSSKKVVDESEFLNNETNTCAVMLSTTMDIKKVTKALTRYQKSCVYFDADSIPCTFTYEWSIGGDTNEKIAASEKLLSWMLGNAYQNELMISRCSDGQLPINEICFKEKISHKNLTPIEKIYNKFTFRSDH